NLTGRALAYGGTVTTDANTITVPNCAPFGSATMAAPTLSEWALIALMLLLTWTGIAAVRRRYI
ncbi:MAG: IPTL-CTERM sorting domain-containing protein, partial [Dokdonella sp.]